MVEEATSVMYNQTGDTPDGSFDLQAGSAIRGGIRVIPGSAAIGQLFRRVSIKLKKTGAPTGQVVITVRTVTGFIKSFSGMLAENLTTSYVIYEFDFGTYIRVAEDDRILVEFSGDGSNYVSVGTFVETIAAGFNWTYYIASYTNGTTKNVMMKFDTEVETLPVSSWLVGDLGLLTNMEIMQSGAKIPLEPNQNTGEGMWNSTTGKWNPSNDAFKYDARNSITTYDMVAIGGIIKNIGNIKAPFALRIIPDSVSKVNKLAHRIKTRTWKTSQNKNLKNLKTGKPTGKSQRDLVIPQWLRTPGKPPRTGADAGAAIGTGIAIGTILTNAPPNGSQTQNGNLPWYRKKRVGSQRILT